MDKIHEDVYYFLKETDEELTSGDLDSCISQHEIKEKIKDILDQIKDIEYGFISKKDGSRVTDREWIHACDNLGDFYETNFDTDITLKNKLGLCLDQSLLISKLFSKLHPDMECNVYALTKGKFGHAVPCFKCNGQYFYLENAWDKEKGLHGPFNSERELKDYLSSIYHKHHDKDNDDEVEVRTYEEYLKESCLCENFNLLIDAPVLIESKPIAITKEKKEILKEDRLPDDGRDPEFGVPEQKKFPLYDEDHVRSAIKFFNYVKPEYEKALASKIKSKMKKYGISEDTVGESNRLKKYL